MSTASLEASVWGNYSDKVHVVNFAFTLLNEGSLASSPVGNHSLVILQVRENYDSLAGSLTDIINEARELQSVTINGGVHRVEYFLGGDLKFLAIVCGIEAANANFSCVWCKCSNTDHWDMDKEWSAFEENKGAKTVKNIEECLKLPKSSIGEWAVAVVLYSNLYPLTTSLWTPCTSFSEYNKFTNSGALQARWDCSSNSRPQQTCERHSI